MSLLGIDLGTSGIKCAAYNEDGKLIGKTYREYKLYMPSKGLVELDSGIVWKNLCLNLIELNGFEIVKKDPIEALSISVSGDEAIPVDKRFNPLYNNIMAMDKRGLEENDWVNSLVGAERVYEITGQPPANLYPLNRLLWFKKNRQDIFEKTYKFLCWEEYIFSKLGVQPVTDYSVTCRTLAFDIKNKQYSEEILNKIGINKDLFPEAFLSGTEIGKANKNIAKDLGFIRDVKIVTGGFDQICAALSCGVTKEGIASINTGTMEVMHVCLKEPVSDIKMMNYGYPFCNHALDNLYITMSINLNGEVIFKWYRDNLSHNEREISKKTGKNPYDVIMDSAFRSRYPVMFLPYFEGSLTPRNNPDVAGAILGMTLRTTREDIIKGMFEGITFDLKLNLKKLEESSIKIDVLRATGGGARSDIWLQIKADITGKLTQKIDVDESGCVAAAVLAGYGTGIFDSIEETIGDWVKVGKEFEPDRSKSEMYIEKYNQWLGIYERLEEVKIIN